MQTARERATDIPTSVDDAHTELHAARLALAQHDLPSAERWASQWASTDAPVRRLTGQDIETLIRSQIFSQIVQATLARLSLARGNPQQALTMLDRMQGPSSEPANRVEVQVLRALAKTALGQSDAAVEDLGVALRLGEQHGFVRTFLDEGEAIAPLLREAARRGMSPAYAERLLAALEEGSRPRPVAPAREALPALKPTPLVEPLTDRESEVPRMLRTALTTPEIAAELGVAPSTVRTFVKNLYGKLGVHRRLEAIERAEEVGLLRASS